MSNNKVNHAAVIVAVLMSVGLISNSVEADLIVNFEGNRGAATLMDFQVADGNLEAGTAVSPDINSGGAFAGLNFTGSDGVVVTSNGSSNNGFAISNASHVFNQPIIGGNLFTDNNGSGNDSLGLNFAGLSSVSAGSTIVLTAYGIGDNLGQDTTFTAVFGGNTQVLSTVYNDGTGGRGDNTGSVPFVQFTYAADGTTDLLTLTSLGNPDDINGAARSFFSGVSLSVTAVPEPSGVAMLGLTSMGMIICRRRKSRR